MVNLLKKRVSTDNLSFLQFLYPQFVVVSSLNLDIDYTKGVIYTGTITESIINNLDLITKGNYILVTQFGDIKLNSPSDYISTLLPILKGKAKDYDTYELDEFLPILKQYYLLQEKPPILKDEETHVYRLFKSLVASKNTMREVYFNLIQDVNISKLEASIFTFLIKVKEKNFSNCSDAYKLLLNQAYLRFGKNIRGAIQRYISLDCSKEVALWLLLESL